MAGADLGRVLEELVDAGDAERPVGRLRLIAATATIIGSAYVVAATGGTPLSWVLVLVVLVAASFWWRRFVAVERAARNSPRRLRLATGGLELSGGATEPRAQRWSEIERIEVDRDRLVLRVVPVGAEPWDIEPPLAGLGIDELGQHIDRARRRAGLSKNDQGDHDSSIPGGRQGP